MVEHTISRVFTFAASARGERHKKSERPCEDFTVHFRDGSRSIAVVSDGHGSEACFRSERGARFACEAAVEGINGFIDSLPPQRAASTDIAPAFDEKLRCLCAAIHAAWQQRVLDDWRGDPPDFAVLGLNRSSYAENICFAYGCTLLAVAATNNFWFGIHIGDGKCIALEHGGGFSEPIPWDETCQFNITTSLCEENAPELFRVFSNGKLPEAVFIGTDGVDSSYRLEGNGEKVAGLYRIILDNFRKQGFDKGGDELRNFLPALTERGSGDDVSIAGILFAGEE
jgi:hypothetical protein